MANWESTIRARAELGASFAEIKWEPRGIDMMLAVKPGYPRGEATAWTNKGRELIEAFFVSRGFRIKHLVVSDYSDGGGEIFKGGIPAHARLEVWWWEPTEVPPPTT